MSYSEVELNSLIADVEKEFSKHLAKAEESFILAKSEDFPPKKKEEPKDEDKKEDSEPKKEMESEKPEDKGVKDQHQQQDGAKEGQADEGSVKPEGHEGGEEHGYDDEDMQHMHSMYSSMSKPELKAHHDAVRKCMDSHGLSKCEDGMAKAEMEDAKDGEHRPNGGPSDGEAAKCKTPATSGAQALEKSEPSIEISLLKSELEVAKASEAESKKNLEAVESFLKKFVERTAPVGKAITSLDIIAKTESGQAEKPLSKSEIDAKLLIQAKNPSLQKSDRDAINSYYFSKNIQTVSHLLK